MTGRVRLFPGYSPDAPLDLGGLSDEQVAGLLSRVRDGSTGDLSVALAGVHNCAHPIRLTGSSVTVDRSTGEVVSSFSSADAPLGVVMVPCGNRRASVCPACSRTYAADTFQLLRAGVVGGKSVPDEVAENPLVFATLTAPSFGAVHGVRDGGRPCRPAVTGPARCKHNRPRTCQAVHTTDAAEAVRPGDAARVGGGRGDALVGEPLCPDCYDYRAHVIWQWWAPELWRYFTMALRRRVAERLGVTVGKLPEVAVVQYAKVAEYQHRGVIHFHALIRLDGPKSAGPFAPAPSWVTGAHLVDAVRAAVQETSLTAPPVDPRRGEGLVLRFGAQLDARVVRATARPDEPGQALTGEQVAGYLAKYATKSAGDGIDLDRPHAVRIRSMVDDLARVAHASIPVTEPVASSPYGLLRKWSHMLGFRGHFATKSRAYSVTLGRLRRARARYARMAAQAARDGHPLDVADLERRLLAEESEETTLVVGSWAFAGTGWPNPGDEALALAAAARAREYDQWRAEQRRTTTD